MRLLFYYLLDKYSRTEKDRLTILRKLDEKIYLDYNEQTPFGNVYNHFIEFIMANPFIVKMVMIGDDKSLEAIKKGINTSYDEGISFIKKEAK